jgi:hypothetical protein
MLIAGTFFGFGWSAPEEAHAAAGDLVESSEIEMGDTVYYGNYPQSNLGTSQPSGTSGVDYVTADYKAYNQSSDGDHYFKIEPIAWRVLENAAGKLFLLADKAIDRQPYSTYTNSMTWEKCTARSWLNGYTASENKDNEDYSVAGTNFIGNAFSAAEQGFIPTTDVDNPLYNTDSGGVNTNDKIFYLKVADVNNASYGFTNDDSRKAQATDYAVALGASVNSGNSPWWLRSPGNSPIYAMYVSDSGSSLTNDAVSTKAVAVRPAFYLNTDSLILKESAGGGYLASAQEDNAFLYSLGAVESTLTPAFNSGKLVYNTNIASSSITLTATAALGVTVDGIGTKALNMGLNLLGITVTDNNGTKRIYHVKVTRLPNTDATLSDLEISAGTLSPGFASGIDEYTVSVPYATSSITLTATTTDENATVEGDGTKSLNVGNGNVFPITVTAEDESTEKTYTVTVTRGDPDTDATLSNLSVSAGTLDPVFASGTEEYTVSVPYATDSITLTATKTDANASVAGDGVQSFSGNEQEFEITVTAEDGTTEKTYTVTVTRAAASANANLKSLSISCAALAPAFNANTVNYSANVPNATAQVTIAAATSDANAAVTGAGAKALNVGANKFAITVTAENKTVKTYTVTVTRAAPIPVVKPPVPVYPNVTSIKTSMTKMSIVVKKGTLNLKNLVGLYTTGNKPIKDSKLTWTSSKPKVATVSKTGAVKAGTQTGTTVITVKAQNGKSLKITITVVKKAAKLKKLTGTVPKLKKNKPAFITLKGTGTNITGVKWKVKGKGLKIDKFGMATATKAGKYTITATAGGKKFTKKITVK